jgi:hypothetical protein
MSNGLTGKVISGAQLKNCDKLSRVGSVNVVPNVFEARLKDRSILSVASREKWVYVKLEPNMGLVLG